MPKRISPAFAVAFAAIILSACTTNNSSESNSPVLLDRDGIIAEYENETDKLQLANGDSWESDPIQLSAPDSNEARKLMWEEGIGAQTAQFQWYCSWAREALNQKSDREAALERLERFRAMSVWQMMDDNGHRMFTKIITRAKSGDLDPLSEYVRTNC